MDSSSDEGVSDPEPMEEEEEEERAMESSSSEEEEEEDSDDDDFGTSDPRKKKEKGRRGAPNPARTAKTRAVTPPLALSAAKLPRRSKPTSQVALKALARVAERVLNEDETPETSLFAALLRLLPLGNGGKKKRPRRGSAGAGETGINPEDGRIAKLDEIARRVLDDHDNDPNKAQLDLYNLLFRSVGAGYDALIDPVEIDIENASDEDWADIITNITEAMGGAASECVLFTSDPEFTGGGRKMVAAAGPVHYRELYKLFWYRLGTVVMAKKNDDEEESQSARFQIETARDILNRMIEISSVGMLKLHACVFICGRLRCSCQLTRPFFISIVLVPLGQPDIRSAACVAIYEFTLALLDHSRGLVSSVHVATRQLNANRGKTGRKAETLQNQIDSGNRTLKEIQELVISSVMNGVFSSRYRDTNKFIRAESLDSALRFILSRPDLLLRSTYLKYFGWMLNDKEALVRSSALQGFLVPLKEARERKSATSRSDKNGPRIDKAAMATTIAHFAQPIVDRVTDVDLGVQEIVMELNLLLLKEGFFDDVEDDSIWNQINLRAMAIDATPKVRRDALSFVIEQIESFDFSGATTEGKTVERIIDLAKW